MSPERARSVVACVLAVWACVLACSGARAQTEPPPSAAVTRIGLREAIELALRREPRMESARLEIARAEALANQARSASYPTLDGNVVYTRLDDDRKQGTRVVAAQDELEGNLELTVPLIAPQRWARASTAGDEVEAERRDADDVKRQVAVAVTYAYLAVIVQHRARDVAEQALATARAHYDYAHTRFEGGVGNRLDDLRAGQEVAVSEAQLERVRAGLARAQEGLGVLLGREGPADAADDVALPDAPARSADLERTIEARSDVIASRTRVQVAESVAEADWVDYMPLLAAKLVPFLRTPGTTTQPTAGWQAQLVLSVPLYDGGVRYGQQAEREALAAQRRSVRDAILRQARSEVRLAFVNIERADAGLVAAAKAAQLASEALELATLAYKAGATTNVEVIDAERRARDAASAAVVAEDEARRARVELLVATGRLP